MSSFLVLTLLALCGVHVGQAFFAGELKPLVNRAVDGIKKDVLAQGAQRSLNKLPEYFAAALEEEAVSRMKQFETAILEYETKTAQANAIIHKATEALQNPPMEKLNYEAIVAEDLLRLMPKIQELTKQAQEALKVATQAAAAFSIDGLTSAVAVRLSQDRGILSWIGDIVTGGPTWIIENLASLATSLSPSSALSVFVVQNIAQTIVDTIGSLGGSLTQMAATNLLAFLGPFKEPLGDLYDQIVWSLQQTFPIIFDRK